MNESQIDELSERMVEYFSEDAAAWRPAHVAIPLDQPLTVDFRFEDGEPFYAQSLLRGLRERLASPYVNHEASQAAAIMHARPGEMPDATIELYPDARDGQEGIAYQLTFADSVEVFPGWFASTTS